MGDFFKGAKFRVLLCLLVMVFAFTLRAAHTGTLIPFVSKVTAWLLTPVQRVSAQVSYTTSDVVTQLFSGKRLAGENEQIRLENAELRQQLAEYERLKTENDQLREYLDIKDRNPDFDFEPAMVIGRDTAERFYSFTIDKGSTHGVSANDPVITSEGIVGIVMGVGITHSTVLTILDSTVEVGAINSATREVGITSGDLLLSQQGLLRMSYLPRDSKAATGDLIVTTGIGGIFPRELVIGTAKEIQPDSNGLSLNAIIEPPADLRSIRHVLVIKYFDGQASKQ